MISMKHDTHAIWFKHLPVPLSERLASLPSDSRTQLEINGVLTTWARMRPSAGRPTPGMRIVSGRLIWEGIARGAQFDIDIVGAENICYEAAVERPPPLAHAVQAQTRLSSPTFDCYEFADFSGAKDKALQRRTIRLAIARGDEVPKRFGRSLTREALQEQTLQSLATASTLGLRLAFGRDHQYSIPYGLALEIGIAGTPWRDALRALATGSYGGPPLSHASEFAAQFNSYMRRRGSRTYFFSCTKAAAYGISGSDPRPSQLRAPDATTYRLTELAGRLGNGARPKPFNRLGDNGTVGGQTIVGLLLLHELLETARDRGIPVAVWPFDGVDITADAYRGRHVMFEPYPSSIRAPDKARSDWNDAEACVLCIQGADQSGRLSGMLDLCSLGTEIDRVLFEGWIVGHRP